MSKASIVKEFIDERARQDEKHGFQSYPVNHFPYFTHFTEESQALHLEIPSPGRAKFLCDGEHQKGGIRTWSTILIEEVSEAVCERDVLKARAELVQVGAVVLAMIEDIDKKIR